MKLVKVLWSVVAALLIVLPSFGSVSADATLTVHFIHTEGCTVVTGTADDMIADGYMDEGGALSDGVEWGPCPDDNGTSDPLRIDDFFLSCDGQAVIYTSGVNDDPDVKIRVVVLDVDNDNANVGEELIATEGYDTNLYTTNFALPAGNYQLLVARSTANKGPVSDVVAIPCPTPPAPKFDPDEFMTVCMAFIDRGFEQTVTSEIRWLLSPKMYEALEIDENGELRLRGDNYWGECDQRTPGSEKMLAVSDPEGDITFCDNGTTHVMKLEDTEEYLAARGAIVSYGQGGTYFDLPDGITAGPCKNLPPVAPELSYDPNEVMAICKVEESGFEFTSVDTVNGHLESKNFFPLLLTVDENGNLQITGDNYEGDCDGRTPGSEQFLLVESKAPDAILEFCDNGTTRTMDFESSVTYLTAAGALYEEGGQGPSYFELPIGITAGACAVEDVPEPGDSPSDEPQGSNQLIVELEMFDEADLTGSTYSLFAPMAAQDFQATPIRTGLVGAGNMIDIDGLIPGMYRLTVQSDKGADINAIVTVGQQKVTRLIVNVDAKGEVKVQDVTQTTAPAPTPGMPDEVTGDVDGETDDTGEGATNADPSTDDGEKSDSTAKDADSTSVTSLPVTGSGSNQHGLIYGALSVAFVAIAGTALRLRRS